ncbi:MAG: phosphotransferase [Rhodospirillales bacterium]|nr:phosphotransferase [Rhodospirillales bacterium]
MDIEAEKNRVRGLPCWQGSVDVEPLSGGLSNLNFVVTSGGKRFVVRIVGGDVPVHCVMRFNELTGLKAAHAVGLTPGLVYNEPGIMVLDFLEGKTFEPEDVCNTDNLMRIVHAVRKLHEEAKHHIAGPCLAFWVFKLLRNNAKILHDGNSRMVPNLDHYMAINDELESVVGAVELTFCHSDLLPANFIDTGDKIWLIDWEHSGYGSRLFDLANIASNAELPEEAERQMLESYYGESVDDQRWRRFKAFRAASHLREAMWSMVSEIHLDLDVDYVAYTRENLDAFEVAYEDFKKL